VGEGGGASHADRRFTAGAATSALQSTAPPPCEQLNDRKGFVRLAMKHGVPLVPVVVYNEREAYTRVDLPAAVKNFCLTKLRVPLLLFYGAVGLLPRRLTLGIVFGAPLAVPHMPNVDAYKTDPAIAAAVDVAHAAYVAALTALWHEHKARFGYGPEQRLVVV
jgi:1-acyl-sn-glycerol-3-phosphate acyltransferase